MKRRSFTQSDHIRLNLQWLDRRDSFHPSLGRIFAELPILPLSIAVIAGIIIAAYLSMSAVFAGLLFCLTLSAVLLVLGFFKLPPKLKLWITFTAAVLLFVALGAARFAAIRYCPPRHISRILKEEQQLATLRGRITSPVRTTEQNRGFSGIPWLNAQSSFYLSVSAIQTPFGWEDICGTVRVQVNEQIHHVRPGNTVQVYCRLSRFSPPANPGQFDLQKHMNARGIFVAASVPIAEGIERLDNNYSLLYRLRSRLYRFSADALLDETATDPDVYALVSV